MALKVMVSSVRRGLADVRDAVAPVLKILDYEVIRFETVTKATSEPPRATCVAMVESADIYLLILGEEYGDPMPGTDLAPTEEEWTVARNLGKPVVVFEKVGINPGPRQAAFIKKVKDYEIGAWRATFVDTGDLLSKLQAALADAAEGLRPAASTSLTAPVTVPWLQPTRGIYMGAGTVFETHVLPVEATTLLPAASFADLRRTLAGSGQEHGLFELGQAIEFETQEADVVAHASRDGRRPEAGVRVGRNRAVSIWESLPSAPLVGAILDELQFTRRVARDLRLTAALGVIHSPSVAIGIGFGDVSMLGIPNAYGGGMSLPFAASGNSEVHLEPSDAWPTRALAAGADGIAGELVARLMLRLKRR